MSAKRRIEGGALRVEVDRDLAALCRLFVGGDCAVYRIFAAYRDSLWGTPPPRVTLLHESADRFAFRSSYEESRIGLEAESTIALAEDRITYDYVARVTRTVLRNRLGICVLLPATLAGSELEIGSSDGRSHDIELPTSISPHQPCTDIATLSYDCGGSRVTIQFAGEVFEMEDQRNWTDFSYKVYSTPLDLPAPVRLEAGTEIRQSVTVVVAPSDAGREPRAIGAPGASAAERKPAAVTVGGPAAELRLTVPIAALPELGTRSRRPGEEAPPLDFIRIDRFADDRSLGAAGRARGLPVAAFLWRRPDEPVASDLPSESAIDPVAQHAVIRLGVADVTDASVSAPAVGWATESALASAEPLVGTEGAFAELNRLRPERPANAGVTLTVSPEVHDADDEVVLDNLFGLRHVLRDSREIYPDAPLHLSLVELTPHFNPASGAYDPAELLRSHDPRTATGFALSWAAAVFIEAARAGVASLCLFDASGAGGLVDDNGWAPAAHLFADMARLRERGTGDAALLLPAAAVGSDRRYALGGGGAVIAVNLGDTPWRLTSRELSGELGVTVGSRRARLRIIGQDGGRLTRAAFGRARSSASIVGLDQAIELPAVSYAFIEVEE